MKTLLSVSFVLGMLLASMLLSGTRAVAGYAAGWQGLRTSRLPRQSGKLEALHARFRDHACKLFQKHGMELIAFWTPTDGEEAKDTLIYIVAFPSVEAQKKAWQAFRADPDSIKVSRTRKRRDRSRRR